MLKDVHFSLMYHAKGRMLIRQGFIRVRFHFRQWFLLVLQQLRLHHTQPDGNIKALTELTARERFRIYHVSQNFRHKFTPLLCIIEWNSTVLTKHLHDLHHDSIISITTSSKTHSVINAIISPELCVTNIAF